MSPPRLLPFVQLEIAGAIGIDPGRYLIRGAPGPARGGEPDDEPGRGREVERGREPVPGRETEPEPGRVLVIAHSDAPASMPARRGRRRLRRSRPRPAEPGAVPATVPTTTVTMIRSEPFADEAAAARWLSELRGDRDALAAELEAAIRAANRAVHAHRTATLDPGLADLTAARAEAVRVGYGTGDQLAEARHSAAISIPHSERRRRGELLAPQERLTALLGGHEEPSPCEELVVRARADLDAGRAREAALQARAAVEALLADRSAFAVAGQEQDLAALAERRPGIEAAARTALRERPSPAEAELVAAAVALCERILRRQRAGGG